MTSTSLSAPQPKTVSPILPIVVLVIAMVSIQFGATFAKRLFPVVGAEGATALRLGLAAIILAPIGRPWRVKFTRQTLPALIAYGVALGCMNLLFYNSLRTIPLGLAVGLEFTGPLTMSALSSRRPVDFVWIALAVVGLVLLSPFSHLDRPLDPIGALSALGAGGLWVLYAIFGKKAGSDHGVATTSFGILVGALIAMPIGFAHAGMALFSPSILLSAVVVAVFSSALPFSLEMVALTRLPTRVYGVLTSLEPAIAAAAGLAFLHETLTLVQMIAIGAIMVAAFGSAASINSGALTPDPA